MSEIPEWNSEYQISEENKHWLKRIESMPEPSCVERNPWSYLFGDPHECYGEPEWHPFMSNKKRTLPSMAKVIRLFLPEASENVSSDQELQSPTSNEMEVPSRNEHQDDNEEMHTDFACADELSTEPCFPLELAQLFLCSSQQVEAYCTSLKLSAYNDDDTIKFCNFLNGLKIPLSASLGAILFQCSIFSKVASLHTCMSRSLATAVMQLANNFPQAVTEGILVPCIRDIEIGSYQRDILMKIIKTLPEQYIQNSMHKILENVGAKESVLPLVQAFLDRKVNLDESYIGLLVTKMQEMSLPLIQNTTFGKLLVSTLVTLEGQLLPPHISVLKEIINNHKTFLSKTAARLLQKLESS